MHSRDRVDADGTTAQCIIATSRAARRDGSNRTPTYGDASHWIGVGLAGSVSLNGLGWVWSLGIGALCLWLVVAVKRKAKSSDEEPLRREGPTQPRNAAQIRQEVRALRKRLREVKASTWTRPLKGWRWLAAWALLLACLAALTRIALGLTSEYSYDAPAALPWLLSIGIALSAAIFLGLLVCALSSWRNFKRSLLGLACLVGLIALFYAEEDLRGRLAWGHFKAQWEAKGEKFDFAAFIPPAVPDDQNFAMTPLVATAYSQILDRHGQRISPLDTNVVNRLQMPLEVGGGGPTNGIGNWQKALSSNLEP
jgi:hypothetical protein